ncbi:MAG: C-terminal target protein, partial [Ferruginibacter sp.]|nr:C-terminal target protein [Ferruginibacter sp.]
MSKIFTSITLAFILFLSIGALNVQGQATVTTDKPDYAPRSNAVFTGSGFQPGEDVVLKVKNLFRACNTVTSDSSYLPWTVTADANGGFVANWIVCDCLGDSLRLKATGQTSGLIAYALFSDAKNWDNGGDGINWSSANNWNPNGVPTNGDGIITIGGPNTVTLDINNAQSASLQLADNNNSTAKLQFNNNSKLTVSGAVTFGNGGNAARKGSVDMTNGGTLISTGFVATNLGTWIPGTGTVQFTASNTLPAVFSTFNNLEINGGTTSLATPTTINGSLVMTSGILNLANNSTFAGDLQGTANITSNTVGTSVLTVGNNNTSTTYSGVISNGTTPATMIVSLSKNGNGTLILSGSSSYSGATTISSGALSINTIQNVSGGNSSLGAPITVSNGTIIIGATGILRYTGSGHSSNRVINLTGSGSTLDASGSGLLTLTGGVIGNTFNLELSGTGNGNEGGVINTTSGGVTKSGNGKWTLSGANAYTGPTKISAGTLELGIANAIKTGAGGARSNIILNGGTLSSGNSAGFNDGTTANPMGTLELLNSSTINLGTGNHTIAFAASNGIAWNAGNITIAGWLGGYNGSPGGVTTGKIFVGSSSSGLTNAQLSQIQFKDASNNLFPAIILSTGEVVPVGNSISSGTITGSPFCGGQTGINVPFTYALSSNFPSGTTTFTAQLSNNLFSSFTSLQSVASDGTGSQTISVIIPAGTQAGSNYRIRVVSNTPAINGSPNGADLTIDIISPLITCPGNMTVNCQDDNSSTATGVATATDNCTPAANITITQTETSTYSADPFNVLHYNYVITRTWKATDVAGNFSTCPQTITVHDVTKPVLGTIPTDVTVNCDAVPAAAVVSATDNCDPAPAVSLNEVSTQVGSVTAAGHY